ncbi:folylpolyglutamate synthase/dihydrofolate synthase family protein [uncultured Secundilactobacillus sp.]|uniref:bifunctional folylpolyglutamate synthase/dihydrofolate synthase n=1 Tax=uncultured Secundilactobacillus sp. TaxID=2813935 RepID=UPI00258BC905|nr:cyanophycin synthetase [uncultured Secundilactobacillus sp.]
MPTKQTIHEMYQALIGQFNQDRLVGNVNRVPLLRRLVAALSHPEQHAHVIHIAGTNGKGSTGAMLAAVLQAARFKVGRFSSPAILDDREQIQVNNQWISEADFIDTYTEILPVVQNLGLSVNAISIFEWQFLISIVWFRNQRVDYMILEAGLGGKTDATNAISAPQLTVFNKVALDHMQILGDTIEKIAIQKSKIIKPGTTVVTLGDQAPDALRVLQKEATKQAVPLILAQADITVQAISDDEMTVNVTGDDQSWPNLRLNVIGVFQLQNLRLALAVLSVLRQKKAAISDAAVRTGLQQIQLPDRLTPIGQRPLTLLDVAHNPDGMTALVQSVSMLAADKPIIWILGVLADKAVADMVAIVTPAAKAIITVTPDNPQRAMSAVTLAKCILAQTPGARVAAATSMAEALEHGRQLAGPDGLVVVSGSFYVAREVAELATGAADHDD